MRYICFILIIICAIGTPYISNAQSIFTLEDENNLENQISEKDLNKLLDKLENKEITLPQVLNIARAKGASELQVRELQERIKEALEEREQLKDSDNEDSKTAKDKKTDNSTPNSFSRKIEIPMTEKLKEIYGVKFFNTKNLNFEPNLNTQVSDDYILSTGDNVLINVYGASQKNYSEIINKSRAINILGIGPIHVGGLSLSRAKKLVKARLSSIYNGMQGSNPNTFVSISLGNVSGINVNVIGEANLPGTYTLPATASVFTALYMAGGPGENGSFRNIDILRNGKKLATVDVYRYLVDGDARSNIQLRNNDVILVKPYSKRIFVSGPFKREGIFEAKSGETVADIIKYAGGFGTKAYNKEINLIRNNAEGLTFKTVELNDFAQTEIQNGDKIEAKEVENRFQNRIEIQGAVLRPGGYELTPSMTLEELIKKAGGLKEEAFLDRGIITRKNDNMDLKTIAFSVQNVVAGKEKVFLKREDQIFISSIFDMRERQKVHISGAVQTPGDYNYTENMTLEDLIFIAGGFLEQASASNIEIVRRLDNKSRTSNSDKLIENYTVSVDRNLKLSTTDSQMKLEPFDDVYVRNTPGFDKGKGVVQVLGEVNYAGEYGIATKLERISDIINRAGGLTPEAYAKGASLRRKIILSDAEIEAKQQIFEQDTTMMDREVKREEYTTVAIDLFEIMKNKGGKADLLLEAGDKLLVPRRLQTVKISGSVLNPISITYKKKLNVKDYINMSGGFALNAKKSKVYVIYPNGEAHATTGGIFRHYPRVVPGCEIIVPDKPQIDRTGSAQRWVGIGSGLASIAASVAALLSISRR